MHVNEKRANFFLRAKRQRYAWARKVDPTSVDLFEQRAAERIRKGKEKRK